MTGTLENLNVAVVVGGRSPECDGSRLSGKAVEAALKSIGAQPFVVELNDPHETVESLGGADVAFLATHGWYGEDGKLQGLLELLGLPYTGSGVLTSAIGMHKPTFKRLIASVGIPSARWDVLAQTATREQIDAVGRSLGYPFFLKPASGGESLNAGVIARAEDALTLLATDEQFAGMEFLAEQYLVGDEISVGVLEVDGELVALPPLRILHDQPFYDLRAKTDPRTRTYHCPAGLPADVVAQLAEQSLQIVRLCGGSGFARVDWIATADGMVALELNTIPGLTHQGNFAAMGAAGGYDYPELIGAVLRTAFGRQAYRP